MMNFFNEAAQHNQVELSDIVSSFKVDQQARLEVGRYIPNVDIVHSPGKTNNWSNSKSKRFSFLPTAIALNPGPGHYNQQQLTMTNK
jgi:hypothetical protein